MALPQVHCWARAPRGLHAQAGAQQRGQLPCGNVQVKELIQGARGVATGGTGPAGVNVHHCAIACATVPHVQAVHAIRGQQPAPREGELLRWGGGIAGGQDSIGVHASSDTLTAATTIAATVPANEGPTATIQLQGSMARRGH